MIQNPINVTPQNQAIDMGDPNHIQFTFQGDYLAGVLYRITNYDTGEIEYNVIDQRSDVINYNGDIIQRALAGSGLVNGRRYILQMMLTQRTADNADPICDMPVVGGTILRDATISNVIYVSKGITAIYPWGKTGDTYSPISIDNVLFNPMKIRVNNVTKNVMDYTDNVEIDGEVYGRITLNSSITVNEGDTYQIYSNAIITPQYFFKCEYKPAITLSHTEYSNRMLVTGTYIQANKSPIKYYTLRLLWANNSNFVNDGNINKSRLVEETDKIYSQNIEYVFWNPYDHDEDRITSPDYKDYYRIECVAVTQDNYTISKTETFNIVPEDYSEVLGNTLYEFTLSWDAEKGRVLHSLRGYESGGIGVSGTYELFRKDLRSGEEVKLHPHHFEMGEYATLIGYDLTASTKGNYQYTLKRFDTNGGIIIPVIDSSYTGIGNFPSNTIETNQNAYYITALYPRFDQDIYYHRNESGNKKLEFDTGDTWRFVGEIQNTTVVNNLDTMTYVGYGKYINTTSTDVNYMSGTLSAMIGYVNCAERKYVDDIALVKAWREFITQKISFLLKSQKGDVWIVDVVDSPQTEYDESHSSIPTTFTFSWAECCDVNDIILYDSNAQSTS